jgi:hypothetical protein
LNSSVLQVIGTGMLVSALWVGAVALKLRRGTEKRKYVSEQAVNFAISSWFVFMPVIFEIAKRHWVVLTVLGSVNFLFAAFRVGRAMSSGQGS